MRNIEDIIVNGRDLKDILEKDSYVDLSGANLRDAILVGVDLTDAYLRGADLSGARLTRANLSGANLKGAFLRRADLSDSHLTKANLSCANLKDAYLRGANLRGADLSDSTLTNVNLSNTNLIGADLSGANLEGSNLTDAYLKGANLLYADLRDVNLSETYLSCANLAGANLNGTNEYIVGKMINESIIGYKVCQNGIIVTLEIPKGAIVFSINGNKCRTNKAKVVAIDNENRAFSSFNNMSYYVGDEITVYDFNCMYNLECGKGIHFFLTREEAESYSKSMYYFFRRITFPQLYAIN